MQVSVESISGLERRMTVEVPEERIDSEIQRRLQNLARTTKIDGFRPGKVPMKVIVGRFGSHVRADVVNEMIQSTFYEALTQEKLNPAGMPQIEPTSMEKGGSLAYVATFEVMPELELASLDGVKIEKPTATVEDSDLDKMLETLQQQRTTWEAVTRKAKKGDRLVIDFVGTIDGEEFAGNKGEAVPVTLGGQRMIAGFEEGLIGAKSGESLTLDLTFPEDYGNSELAGKAVQFATTVQSVEAAKLPEMDEEFVQSFGVEGGLDGLRVEVRQNMERELEQAINARIKSSVMDKLIEINDIAIPQALIKSESEALAQQMQQNMHVPNGKSGADMAPSIFEGQAKRRVALGLILSALIKEKGIKADETELRQQVEKLAASYEQPEQVVNWYFADRSRLGEIESLVLEQKVVDWVLENGDFEETASSFSELMNRG